MKNYSELTMILALTFILTCFVAGCQTAPLQNKRDHIIACTKDLIQFEASPAESFDICRQVYQLRAVQAYPLNEAVFLAARAL
jgi:hypothetical protein